MRILFVAADAMEYRGILARVSDVRREHLPVDFARSARLGGHEAIVSTGFCGALEDNLGIADVVAATAIAANGREHRVEAVQAPHAGVVCSIDHVAQSAEEKRRLRESGASAVEMEAAAVADSARMRTIPFYCVRAVTDLAGESMANDFNQALRSDGHFDTIRILRGALSRPTIRFPELIRLRCRCVRAAEALGKFFVSCRF
jgi:nucleoside phosphorylase